jgi:hypothetical protein
MRGFSAKTVLRCQLDQQSTLLQILEPAMADGRQRASVLQSK